LCARKIVREGLLPVEGAALLRLNHTRRVEGLGDGWNSYAAAYVLPWIFADFPVFVTGKYPPSWEMFRVYPLL
jgi:hypothetical protein